MALSSVRLNIETQPIRLEYQNQPRVFDLQVTPHQFQLDTQPAVVEITSRPYGTLEIDSTPSRASYGIYNAMEFAVQAAQRGKQQALEAVGRIAAEGRRLAAIETGENTVPAMAAEASIREAPGVTIRLIDKSDIRYTPNPPRYNPIPGKVDSSFLQGAVNINYQPEQIRPTVIQYPAIRFSTTGSIFDQIG